MAVSACRLVGLRVWQSSLATYCSGNDSPTTYATGDLQGLATVGAGNFG